MPEQPVSSTAPVAPAAPASRLLREGERLEGVVKGTAASSGVVAGQGVITVPGGPVHSADGNTLRDRIPFDLTRRKTTTAHAAEESPG
ncbi:hypothetical protein Slala02_24010 [Streptomyces lavendulae subsp. lavendulae]|nr:hypothetical protein Slala01_60180 [Streptomyces lavendulae subsp. lavendulae]GLX26581.1 hypothetical protein Slala02_24010 [Streptomyces lavendulae subsp. lavendulae]